MAEVWVESTKKMKDSISGVGKAFGRVGDTVSKTFAPQVKAVKDFGEDLYYIFANLETHLLVIDRRILQEDDAVVRTFRGPY